MAENKNYCIMRHQKYHRGRDNIRGLQAEQNREYDDERYYNDIVIPEKTKQNKSIIYSDDFERDIDKVCEKYGVKVGEDSIALIGTVYTASPEWFEQFEKDENGDYTPEAKNKIEKYFLDCIEFQKDHYGVVISAHVHYDQTTPHLQVYSVPVVEVPTLHNYYVEAEEIEKDGKKKRIPLLDSEGHEIRIRDDDCTEKEYKQRLKAHKCKLRRREYARDKDGNVIYHVSLAGARALGNAVQMSDDQTMFAQEVGKKYGLNRGEVTMGTPEHKEHRASLKKQLNDLQQEIKESQEWVAENVKELISTRFDLDSVTEELERTQQALDRKTQELEELEEDIEAARDELEWASEAWKTAKADIRYAAHARGDADEYVEESKEYADSVVSVAEEEAKKMISDVKQILDGYDKEYLERLDKIYASAQITGSTVELFLKQKGLLPAYAAFVKQLKETQLREQAQAKEEVKNKRLEAAFKRLSVFKDIDIFMAH